MKNVIFKTSFFREFNSLHFGMIINLFLKKQFIFILEVPNDAIQTNHDIVTPFGFSITRYCVLSKIS